MRLVCVHMFACACACVRAHAFACTTKNFLTKKNFWPKKLLTKKNFFWQFFFSPKIPPKTFLTQKIFFQQILFLHKTFFFYQKNKKTSSVLKHWYYRNINCAGERHSLRALKHRPRRLDWPEGPASLVNLFTQPLLWKALSSMYSLVFAFHSIYKRDSPVWIHIFHIDISPVCTKERLKRLLLLLKALLQ